MYSIKCKIRRLRKWIFAKYRVVKGQLNGKVEIVNSILSPRPMGNIVLNNFQINNQEICHIHLNSDVVDHIVTSELERYVENLNFVSKIKFNIATDEARRRYQWEAETKWKTKLSKTQWETESQLHESATYCHQG